MGRKSGESADRVLFEELEPRVLLDGNVMVTVSEGGDLKIKGDRLGNNITIGAGIGAGQYNVTGNDGTTVNGLLFVVVENVSDDFKIDMKGGDDVLFMSLLTVPDKLRIKTRWGADLVGVVDVIVQGVANFSGGYRDDQFIVSGSQFHRHVKFEGGRGADDFGGVSAHFYSTVRASGSRGHGDSVWFTASTFDGWFAAYLGAGDDSFRLTDCVLNGGGRANGGWGWDTVTIAGAYPFGFFFRGFEDTT